jgi:hypothetical protein
MLLGIMVLVWGTGYKASLYKVKSEANPSPPAKICTRSSDVAKSVLDIVATDHEDVSARLLFDLLSYPAIEAIPARPRSLRTDLILIPPSLCLTPSVNRRPPPAESRLLLA